MNLDIKDEYFWKDVALIQQMFSEQIENVWTRWTVAELARSQERY